MQLPTLETENVVLDSLLKDNGLIIPTYATLIHELKQVFGTTFFDPKRFLNQYSNIDELIYNYALSGTYMVVWNKKSGNPVGIIGYRLEYGSEQRPEVVSFDIMFIKEAWGTMIPLESCQSLINYMFKKLRIQRIEAFVTQGSFFRNDIYEKLDFKCEGEARNSIQINGKWTSQKLFGLLKADFNNSKRKRNSKQPIFKSKVLV